MCLIEEKNLNKNLINHKVFFFLSKIYFGLKYNLNSYFVRFALYQQNMQNHVQQKQKVLC